MMIKKIILISFIIFLSCKKYDTFSREDTRTYLDVIELDDKSVRSFFGIRYNSSWEDIAEIFGAKPEEIRENVLRKNVELEGDKAELILFAGDNNIEQISLVLEKSKNEQDIKSVFESVSERISKLGIIPSETVLENDDGTTLEKSYSYSFDDARFFIVLSDDTLSLNISYAKTSSFE